MKLYNIEYYGVFDMISLENGRESIRRIINAASKSFNVEIAVFDKDCNLVESTREYREKKGSIVHTPSLREVINKGNVLVSNPGYMDSCVGCRFYNNCPSTAEILSSIRFNDLIFGVISMTSFTNEGQNRLVENLDTYISILNEISYLISLISFEKRQNRVGNDVDRMIQMVMDLSSKEAIAAMNQYMDNRSNKLIVQGKDSCFTLDEIKGDSLEIQQLKAIIGRVANSPSTVLLNGETGTGKELFAKAIHYNSSRANMPFISINCASIPESLFESELFGYDEGAFTGARKGGKPGKFELARGGTLFLDEIGDMPICLQAKLLRVLQEHVIERVGGTRSIPIEVRIIAATNKNLEEMVLNKEFREDLYYRISVIPVTIPPLRLRKSDIEILALYFLDKYNKKLNKVITSISEDAMDILYEYDWPGNVRELENVIEYAINIETDNIISIRGIPERLKKHNQKSVRIKSKIQNAEIDAIKAALDRYGWDVNGKTEAARELGIGLRTLYRKIKDFEIGNK